MKPCHRCSKLCRRRHRCAICERMLCRDCTDGWVMQGEARWCRTRDEVGNCIYTDCKELVKPPYATRLEPRGV